MDHLFNPLVEIFKSGNIKTNGNTACQFIKRDALGIFTEKCVESFLLLYIMRIEDYGLIIEYT